MNADLERIHGKAARKRLELRRLEIRKGVWRCRLVDTKYGVLAFECRSLPEAERFIDARCTEMAAR